MQLAVVASDLLFYPEQLISDKEDAANNFARGHYTSKYSNRLISYDQTFRVISSTSGIGRKIARQLTEAGGHVVMAVRNTSAACNLIREWSGQGLPLNIEVMEVDLLSLDSVM